MFRTEEQILIVYSVSGTSKTDIDAAKAAITSYIRKSSSIMSVITKPYEFYIPSGSAPGISLGTELTKQLQNSIGAIVFIDDLRPNIAYELGFFHGQGKTVLLVTRKQVEEAWKAISDLSGCALLSIERESVTDGIHHYIDRVYSTLSTSLLFPAPELPIPMRNMIGEIGKRARIPVLIYNGDFGQTMRVDTWGGIRFDVGYNLLPDAKFKIVIRGESKDSTYSIYFQVKFINALGDRRTIWLGLTSNQEKTRFEANERNIASQHLTRNWHFLTASFTELLKRGQVLGVQRVECLNLISVRAGKYQSDPSVKNPSYEIGYFEIIGIDY